MEEEQKLPKEEAMRKIASMTHEEKLRILDIEAKKYNYPDHIIASVKAIPEVLNEVVEAYLRGLSPDISWVMTSIMMY